MFYAAPDLPTSCLINFTTHEIRSVNSTLTSRIKPLPYESEVATELLMHDLVVRPKSAEVCADCARSGQREGVVSLIW